MERKLDEVKRAIWLKEEENEMNIRSKEEGEASVHNLSAQTAKTNGKLDSTSLFSSNSFCTVQMK